jgi:OOP family OmpA-OmpF porin
VLKGVFFDTAKWNIKSQSYPVLDEAVGVLKRNPSLKVEIQGHTDSRGAAKYNQRLSDKRAKSVMEYFVKKGISRDQLTADGYGETMPAATNTTEEGRAMNRRVELQPIR